MEERFTDEANPLPFIQMSCWSPVIDSITVAGGVLLIQNLSVSYCIVIKNIIKDMDCLYLAGDGLLGSSV